MEVVTLLLAGPGSGLAEIDEFFTKKLGLPAIQVDPVNALQLNMKEDISTMQRAGIGTVLGLGMRMI